MSNGLINSNLNDRSSGKNVYDQSGNISDDYDPLAKVPIKTSVAPDPEPTPSPSPTGGGNAGAGAGANPVTGTYNQGAGLYNGGMWDGQAPSGGANAFSDAGIDPGEFMTTVGDVLTSAQETYQSASDTVHDIPVVGDALTAYEEVDDSLMSIPSMILFGPGKVILGKILGKSVDVIQRLLPADPNAGINYGAADSDHLQGSDTDNLGSTTNLGNGTGNAQNIGGQAVQGIIDAAAGITADANAFADNPSGEVDFGDQSNLLGENESSLNYQSEDIGSVGGETGIINTNSFNRGPGAAGSSGIRNLGGIEAMSPDATRKRDPARPGMSGGNELRTIRQTAAAEQGISVAQLLKARAEAQGITVKELVAQEKEIAVRGEGPKTLGY